MMEALLENAAVVIVLVLAVVLWVLYHQLFHVVYFGNGFNAMFGEFLVCFLISILIVGFVGKIFIGIITAIGSVLRFVGTLLWGLIKIALVIFAALIVIAIISVILEKLGIIKSAPKETTEAGEGESTPNHDQDIKE